MRLAKTISNDGKASACVQELLEVIKQKHHKRYGATIFLGGPSGVGKTQSAFNLSNLEGVFCLYFSGGNGQDADELAQFAYKMLEECYLQDMRMFTKTKVAGDFTDESQSFVLGLFSYFLSRKKEQNAPLTILKKYPSAHVSPCSIKDFKNRLAGLNKTVCFFFDEYDTNSVMFRLICLILRFCQINPICMGTNDSVSSLYHATPSRRDQKKESPKEEQSIVYLFTKFPTYVGDIPNTAPSWLHHSIRYGIPWFSSVFIKHFQEKDTLLDALVATAEDITKKKNSSLLYLVGQVASMFPGHLISTSSRAGGLVVHHFARPDTHGSITHKGKKVFILPSGDIWSPSSSYQHLKDSLLMCLILHGITWYQSFFRRKY